VKIGKKSTNHELSFNVTADTQESYAVQNAVDGKNPIAAYNSSYVDSRNYKVVYTWRAGNPMIRGQKDFTTAWQPIAGTGNDQEFDLAGDIVNKAVAWSEAQQKYEKTGLFAPEEFFDFWYSEKKDATIEDNADNKWKKFTTTDGETPNVKTMSMRAAIKAGVANRLIDGGIYKIRMTILREDAQTVWSVVNTYDIDIQKDMPTSMPAAFGIKSKQLTDGNIKFYLRPYANVDFEYASGSAPSRVTRAPAATDPWVITWTNFILNPANATNFATFFDGDYYLDKDGNKQDIDLHYYRWAMDTRMYNLEGIFDGLYIDELDANGNKTGRKTIDKNYIIQFNGVGSYAAALSAKKGTATWAEVDALETVKNGDALSVFDTKYDLSIVNPDQLAHKKGAYTLPLIHWSHLGETKTVSAGYIYRNISANLNDDKTAFLKPSGAKAGKAGLEITNDDYEIDIQPIMVKVNNADKQLEATYACALNKAITLTQDATVNTFAYNKDIAVDATKAKFALSSAEWEAGNTAQAYFNTKFDAAWKVAADPGAGTLADWIKKWCWIDVTSLKANPSGWEIKSYYDQPTFMCGTTQFNPQTNKFSDITGISMMRSATSQGLNDLQSDLEGTFSFDIYDIWFHKKTITLSFKVTKPTNGTGTTAARQAK
jgi:hypothetical protein